MRRFSPPTNRLDDFKTTKQLSHKFILMNIISLEYFIYLIRTLKGICHEKKQSFNHSPSAFMALQVV
jgi:hypothetical protein